MKEYMRFTRKSKGVFLLLIIILHLSGCDNFHPKTSFRLAVPEGDHSYYNSSQHLKTFLEQGGFHVQIITTDNVIEANRMVAQGKADLTFIMNHSDFIPIELGVDAGKLRTICPLFERLFFLFSKYPVSDSLNARELLAGKKIGIEVLNGETHSNLKKLISSGEIENVSIVRKDQDPDLIHFWGTYYGPRATELIENNWKEVSLDDAWVNFITLNEPALKPFYLPAIPGLEGSKNLSTFSGQTFLIGNSQLGEKAVFKLSTYIFQHKLELMGYDLMYRSVNERVDLSSFLYPLHRGTDAYFRRGQPTFIERYAELMAVGISIGAVLFGAFQAIRNRMMSKKKERIDQYFLEFLEIRSDSIDNAKKTSLLDNLLQRALIQMTNEKLDKLDFYIFSRMVQQELSSLK